MKLNFFKYHGTGNDFILIDNRENQFIADEEVIEAICHRRFGIGADGLITLNYAPGYDFGMKYYNSDGQESTMCGNGGRCIVAFADFLSLSPINSRFLAADGEHRGSVIRKNGNVCHVKLSMRDVKGYERIDNDFLFHTGSPHLVRFVTDVDKVDVFREGRALRNLDTFLPEGINVNFAADKGSGIYVRTYERGVEDETLSCGTGVTASALAYAIKKELNEGKIAVSTRGGLLSLYFRRAETGFTDIFLEGPAVKVFQGTIDI